VTSHITVSAPTGNTAATGLSTPKTAGSPLGVFGAILDSLAGGGKAAPNSSTASGNAQTATKTGFTTATATTSTSTGSGTPSILELLERLLHLNAPANQPAATTNSPAAETAQLDTATAPLEATAGTDPSTGAGTTDSTDAGTPPKLLKNVLEALKQIDKAEQSGEPVGDDLLKKAKKAIDALQAFLAGQPAAAPVAATAAADSQDDAVAGVGAADTKSGQQAAARLATAKASLTALSDKLETLSQATSKLDPDLSSKLDALAKSIDPKTLSPTTISALGLDSADAPADPALASAINGLVNGKVQSAAALQPALGTPQLQLPDSLAAPDKAAAPADPIASTPHGSASATPASTTASQAVATRDAPGGKDGDAGKSSGKGADQEAQTAAATAQAATDRPADVSNSNSPANGATAAVAATGQTATARLAEATYQTAAAAPINLPQMAYEIVRHVQQGQSHFQIRLDPADMGRVDVKLAIDQSGAVNARLTVERPETLDLLRRDAGQLGQALSQAGLDAGKTNLQFSLSQNPFTRQDGGSAGSTYAPAAEADDDAADTVAPVAGTTTVYRGSVAASGLNLFV